jgi:hypothetical protein
LLFWDLGTRKSRAPGPVYGPVDLQLNLGGKERTEAQGAMGEWSQRDRSSTS